MDLGTFTSPLNSFQPATDAKSDEGRGVTVPYRTIGTIGPSHTIPIKGGVEYKLLCWDMQTWRQTWRHGDMQKPAEGERQSW